MQKAIRVSIILFFSIIFVLFCFASYRPGGKTDTVVVNIGESSKFTEEEISKAVDCVKKKFHSSYTGCTLVKIWYDEEKSNSVIEGYLQNGRGSINGVNPENIIVLFSDFEVDSSGGDGTLNPNSTYKDYNWILIRGNQRGKWRVDDNGLGL